MLGGFTVRTSFPSEGGRGEWGSTSYRTTRRTAGSCEDKEWTLHEHVTDGKLHKYNMFTAINLTVIVCARLLHTDGVHALCTHTRCHHVHNQWKIVTLSHDRFDFSHRLAKGFQPKNTKVSNCWALKLNSERATAHKEHMDESNRNEPADCQQRRTCCVNNCVNLWWKSERLTKPSIHRIQLILYGLERYIRQEWPQTPVNFMSHYPLPPPIQSCMLTN